jgi:arginine/lysine/ornithine decarboxylase
MPDQNMITASTQKGELAVDSELKTKSDAVLAEAKIKKEMIEQNAQLRLAEKQLQVDEALKIQQMAIDKEAQAQLMMLQEQAITQKTLADEQAAIKIAEQAKLKAMADMAAKTQAVQKEFMEREMRMNAEYQKVRAAGARSGVFTSAVPTVPPGVPVAMPGMQTIAAMPTYAAPPPATVI